MTILIATYTFKTLGSLYIRITLIIFNNNLYFENFNVITLLTPQLLLCILTPQIHVLLFFSYYSYTYTY